MEHKLLHRISYLNYYRFRDEVEEFISSHDVLFISISDSGFGYTAYITFKKVIS